MRTVIVYKDPESDAFLAKVPSLPGCHSDGASPQEATQNVKEAIDLMLEYLRETGQNIQS